MGKWKNGGGNIRAETSAPTPELLNSSLALMLGDGVMGFPPPTVGKLLKIHVYENGIFLLNAKFDFQIASHFTILNSNWPLPPIMPLPQGRRSIFQMGGGSKSKENVNIFGALRAQNRNIKLLKYNNIVIPTKYLKYTNKNNELGK